MKCHTASLFTVSVFVVVFPLGSAALNARDADSAGATIAAAKISKQKCMSVCRARYRDCVSLKQIPSFECRGVHQDCVHDTCDVVRG